MNEVVAISEKFWACLLHHNMIHKLASDFNNKYSSWRGPSAWLHFIADTAMWETQFKSWQIVSEIIFFINLSNPMTKSQE